MGRPKLTAEGWLEGARARHGDRYEYPDLKKLFHKKVIPISCKEHGKFQQQENNHRNGAGCPACGLAARQALRSHSYVSFLAKAREVHGTRYEYPEQEVYNSRTVMPITCSVHGEFQQAINVHLLGQGCKKCGYAKNGQQSQLSLSEFMKRAQEIHGDTYEYISGYTGMHNKMQIKCSKHGVFKQDATTHLKGAGCPRCANHVSKGETEVADFIRGLGVDIICSSRSIIKPYELDIYVPSLKLGIEYHGLWFHREEYDNGKTRKKWELADAQGITLVQMFEDEWRDQRPKIENRLRALLGLTEKVGARQCVAQRVDHDEAKKFFREHHTQGVGANAALTYGLYHGGVLKAAASFGEAKRFGNGGWELLRYCSIGRVVGGVSKLVAAFRQDYPDGDLTSYADLRWGNGDGYAAAGFTLDSITEPDYWWADCVKVKRISRYSVQPKKTGMPEKEYVANQGWHKILGVGHKKWVQKSLAQP